MSGARQRFRLDGSDELELSLHRTCATVGAELQRFGQKLAPEAVLLGGGYGRGEGGVLRTPDGHLPYNDLEFYVFPRGSAPWAHRQLRAQLTDLGHRLGTRTGIEFEFKVLTFRKLKGSPASMFYYDLVSGHRWVIGTEDLLAGCEHHRDGRMLPLYEATRLVMNRCSGLLFAAERLARTDFGAEEADFVRRNLAKARLSFGDAWLTAHGQYHWSCLQRHEHLKQFPFDQAPPWTAELPRHHATGVEFKLHPFHSTESRKSLAVEHAELTAYAEKMWLWLESRRLGVSFSSPRDYALSRVNKCPETRAWKNILLNLRTFGRDPKALGAAWIRYPRERVLHTLCLMLFRHGAPLDGKDLAVVQRELRTRVSQFPDLVESFRRLWCQFN